MIRGSIPLIAEIFEVRGDAEIATAHESDDSLKIVALLPSHANLPLLELALDFEVLRFDRVNNFLRFVPLQTLLNFQFLAGMAQRRNGGLYLLHIPQIHAPFAQFADDDLAQAAQTRRVFRG